MMQQPDLESAATGPAAATDAEAVPVATERPPSMATCRVSAILADHPEWRYLFGTRPALPAWSLPAPRPVAPRTGAAVPASAPVRVPPWVVTP